MVKLEKWVLDILADPILKKHANSEIFKNANGILDARVFFKNSLGFSQWDCGQDGYENIERNERDYNYFISEINHDRPTYEHFHLSGTILDVGGGVGTVRQFLSDDTKFISIDPSMSCLDEVTSNKRKAYTCLERPLNFICGMAEFLPFTNEQFDWVHMRSVIDHFHVPDMAMLEAYRVLKDDGNILVGLTVKGGRTGKVTFKEVAKDVIKMGLNCIGIDKYKDHHIWHPTFLELVKLIEDNGFIVQDVYWQPNWNEQVCYIWGKKDKFWK
ncbi:class I SAM-dependent methyltransferase [Anaeromusa acidaminophila]|uniref:class I SAM-dependent methyltransferase n=1 Tax=Anaeromusa acidaminophila TaxID=81464 RepID=UPI00036C0548|nr:class I SAM-dependent methyltransferase [Anaeromusa acidaminophila]